MPPGTLDETDRLLVEALRHDARQSHQAIASQLGVSEGTVRSRIKRLEADGVVRITAIQNIDLLGEESAFAYLWITCERTRLREIGETLSKDPFVGFVAAILGRADLLAIVLQQNTADLVRYVDDGVKTLPGVIDVRIEPILEFVKSDARWGLVKEREGGS